jgi:hypothetical protein
MHFHCAVLVAVFSELLAGKAIDFIPNSVQDSFLVRTFKARDKYVCVGFVLITFFPELKLPHNGDFCVVG